MTVIDTSGVIDLLLGSGTADQVLGLIEDEGELAAPDLLVFEVIAVLRRLAFAGDLAEPRARAALADLGDVALRLFPSLPLREGAWELRESLTAADALFATLARQLGEPLATKDGGLAAAVRRHTDVSVLELGSA